MSFLICVEERCHTAISLVYLLGLVKFTGLLINIVKYLQWKKILVSPDPGYTVTAALGIFITANCTEETVKFALNLHVSDFSKQFLVF